MHNMNNIGKKNNTCSWYQNCHYKTPCRAVLGLCLLLIVCKNYSVIIKNKRASAKYHTFLLKIVIFFAFEKIQTCAWKTLLLANSFMIFTVKKKKQIIPCVPG